MLSTCICIFASAQFSIMSSVEMPEDGEQLSMSSVTDNMGVGYQITKEMMAGIMKNGANYDGFGRYYFEYIYVSLQMPMEEMSENMKLGAGYSYNVWDKLYVEPNYFMPMKEDENGNREGSFMVGVAYKF